MEGRNVWLPGFRPTRLEQGKLFVFRDRVAMRVEVWDTNVGHRDGEGIQSVEFVITDPNGDIVSDITESNAPYCGFGGNDENCPAWVFADNNFKWPLGQDVLNGQYSVDFVITPYSGPIDTWHWSFTVDVPGSARPPVSQYDPDVQIVEIAPGSTEPVVTDRLAFRVSAFDPDAGSQDGAGIQHVELSILDSAGNVVYSRRENNAAYCAFGGGEPDCTVYVFADHGYAWPDGTPIESATYTLRAVATAKDGGTTTRDFTIEILSNP
jgi:hypothetical protein